MLIDLLMRVPAPAAFTSLFLLVRARLHVWAGNSTTSGIVSMVATIGFSLYTDVLGQNHGSRTQDNTSMAVRLSILHEPRYRETVAIPPNRQFRIADQAVLGCPHKTMYASKEAHSTHEREGPLPLNGGLTPV